MNFKQNQHLLLINFLAEIDGLECCPYCPYAVIVDNPDDKIFRCLNPECMKETCR
jgi:TRIAD3 protein (E3 ubiquitin-protein ligase RNF216)